MFQIVLYLRWKINLHRPEDPVLGWPEDTVLGWPEDTVLGWPEEPVLDQTLAVPGQTLAGGATA